MNWTVVIAADAESDELIRCGSWQKSPFVAPLWCLVIMSVVLLLAAWWQPRVVHSWNTASHQSQGYFCTVCNPESAWTLRRSQGLYVWCSFTIVITAFISSAGWAIHISWPVCLKGGTNCNCCTERPVILYAQTY